MTQMTANAKSFKEMNVQHPVVYGSVIDPHEGGARYTLKNDMTFELTRDECRSVGEVRWDL